MGGEKRKRRLTTNDFGESLHQFLFLLYLLLPLLFLQPPTLLIILPVINLHTLRFLTRFLGDPKNRNFLPLEDFVDPFSFEDEDLFERFVPFRTDRSN